jgi:hypothetical protein
VEENTNMIEYAKLVDTGKSKERKPFLEVSGAEDNFKYDKEGLTFRIPKKFQAVVY